MNKRTFRWSLPVIAMIILIYITTLFNWQAILPKVEIASAIEEKAFVEPTTLEELQKADPEKVAQLSKFDGRKFGIKTEVKNQGSTNLCWAYSAAHSVEASLLRSGVVPVSDSRKLDLNPSNIAYNIFNNQSDPLGNTWESASSGNEWNYGNNSINTSQIFSQWRGVVNNEYWSTTSGYDKNLYQLNKAIFLPNNLSALKQAIVQYGAFSLGYPVHSSSTKYYNQPNENASGGHAVSIIGWDDTIPKDWFGPVTPQNNGAWIAKNSWGPNSGENGYFYMSYESAIRGMVSFDFLEKDTYHNNYFYDLSISSPVDSNAFRQNNNNDYLQMGSIFEVKRKSATQKELVKAVNVGLAGDDITCEVQVYTGVNSLYDTPTNGTLAATTTQTFQYGGFYTINLDRPVDLDGSNYFSILVKVHNQTKNAGILGERDDPSNYDFAYAYDTTSKEWRDSKNVKFNSIPRIKAYTVNEKRGTAIQKSLEFANVDMAADKKRVDYNEQEQCPDFSLLFDGQVLQKDVDYRLTYQDNKFPGIATALYTGIGQYSGTKLVNWTIVKPEAPTNIPGIEQAATGSQRHFTVGANITHYSQIALPSGWRWTFGDKAITFEKAEDNYVQYNDENYNRYMWPVTMHKQAGSVQTIDIANCSVSLQGNTSYSCYTGSAIQPKVTVQYNGYMLQENIDYVLQYENNVKVGKATIIVKGNGANYNGEKRITFDIIQAQEPASKPAPIREIFSNESLTTIHWGDGWKLQNENEEISVGTTKTITLIRVDAEGYVNATCTVTVTRLKTSSGGQVTPPNPVPTPDQPTPSPDRPSVEKPEINTPSNTPTDNITTNNSNKSKIILWTVIGGVVVVGGVAFVFVFKKKG